DNRNRTIGRRARRRWNGERPRLKSLFLQMPFPFQRRNVVLDCRRIYSKVLADFPYGRRKAVVLYVFVDEIQNGLLPLGQHSPFIPNMCTVVKRELKSRLTISNVGFGGSPWSETAAS